MVDSFVFANRAVTALQDSVDQFATVFDFGVDDLDRFPTLSGGSKFPVILSDREDVYEICYVTAVTVGGEATVERAREGTAALSWSAGTYVEHCMTAGSFLAAARFVPKGEWSAVVNYLPGDVVEYTGISYIAVTTNLNDVPSAISTDWQQLYQPPGASSTALTWSGDWNSGTTYAIGAYVKYQGKLYVAVAAGLNHLPTDDDYWYPLGSPPDPVMFDHVLTATGTNNYTVTPDPAPAGLYDGMDLTVVFSNANSAACTLTIGALAPQALRPSTGVEFATGELPAGTILELVYRSGSTEFLVKGTGVFGKKIADLVAADTAIDVRLDALEDFSTDPDLLVFQTERAEAGDLESNDSTKLLTPGVVWTDAAPVVTGSTTGTITPDFSTGFNFEWTLGGNVTIAAPSNQKPGQAGMLVLRQDATGGRTVSWNSAFKFQDATTPSPTTTANKVNAYSYYVHSSNVILMSMIRGLTL